MTPNPPFPLQHPRTSDLHFVQINSTEILCEWKSLKSIEEFGRHSGHALTNEHLFSLPLTNGKSFALLAHPTRLCKQQILSESWNVTKLLINDSCIIKLYCMWAAITRLEREEQLICKVHDWVASSKLYFSLALDVIPPFFPCQVLNKGWEETCTGKKRIQLSVSTFVAKSLSEWRGNKVYRLSKPGKSISKEGFCGVLAYLSVFSVWFY